MTYERQQELVAEGEAAYAAGKCPENNPYRLGTAEHGYWFIGWAQAADVTELAKGCQ